MFSILTEMGGHTHPRLRAVRLHRVSTADQAADDRGGLERQRIETARIIQSKDYQVVETIELSDVSGTAFFESPEGAHLIHLAQTRAIEVVVVSELSRLVRIDSLAAFVYLGIFQESNVIVDAGGVIHDFASDSGFLGAGVLALVSGWERRAALTRISQAKNALRAKGLCPSSSITLPFAVVYDRPAERFRYREPDISKLKEAFRLMDEEGLRNLCEIGRQVGIAGPTLRNLLRNRIFVGLRDYLKMADPKRKRMRPGARQGYRPKIDRPKGQEISVRVFPPEEQAVSDERFQRVQAILAELSEHQRRTNPPGKTVNLGAGVLWCACGAPLYTATSSRRTKEGEKVRGYYLCRTRDYRFKGSSSGSCGSRLMAKETMEAELVRFVSKLFDDESFLQALRAARLPRDTKSASTRQNDLERRLAELDRRDHRLLDAVEAGLVELGEAKTRRDRIAEERQLLLAQQDAVPNVEHTSDAIDRILGSGAEGWFAAGLEERKSFLVRTFSRIVIRDRSIIGFKLAVGAVSASDPIWGGALHEIVECLPDEKQSRSEEAPEGHKRCSKCGSVRAVDAFYSGRLRCVECIREENAARYRKKKKSGK